MKNQELHEELREIAPKLAELQGQASGLRVPDGYFAQLENSIFQKIDAEGFRREAAPRPVLSWQPGGLFHRFTKFQLGVAAAASLMLAVASWWVLRPAPAAEMPAQFAQVEISEEDAEAYVFQNLQDFEPTQLAPENPDELPSPLSDSPVKPEDLNSNDVQHLLDEMTDDELQELL